MYPLVHTLVHTFEGLAGGPAHVLAQLAVGCRCTPGMPGQPPYVAVPGEGDNASTPGGPAEVLAGFGGAPDAKSTQRL